MRDVDRGAFDGKCDTDAVLETVNVLREQRMRMVNEQQLKMIYEVLRGRWQEREAKHVRDAEKPRKRLRKNAGK
jgi:protein tyrosine phosphatase